MNTSQHSKLERLAAEQTELASMRLRLRGQLSPPWFVVQRIDHNRRVQWQPQPPSYWRNPCV